MNKFKNNVKELFESGVDSFNSIKREAKVELKISKEIKELKDEVVKLDHKLDLRKLRSENDLDIFKIEIKNELSDLVEALDIIENKEEFVKYTNPISSLRLEQLSKKSIPMNKDLILDRINIVNSIIEKVEDTAEDIKLIKIHG